MEAVPFLALRQRAKKTENVPKKLRPDKGEFQEIGKR